MSPGNSLLSKQNNCHALAKRLPFRYIHVLYFVHSPRGVPYACHDFPDDCSLCVLRSPFGGGGVSKGRGWVIRPNEENAQNLRPEWNDLVVVAVGDRIVTSLNGTQVIDYVDSDCLKEGKTALQLHGGSGMEYWFRNYEIMPLNKEMVELIKR